MGLFDDVFSIARGVTDVIDDGMDRARGITEGSGFVQVDRGDSQTGFQQVEEDHRVWVPPLEDPNYDSIPSRVGDGNGASLPSVGPQQDETFVLLPEQMLNAKLQELCNRVPALQRISYRKDASSFVATLDPFRILIPRGEVAAIKGVIYLVLR